MIELNRIYNESCLNTLRRMPNDSIDCCVTLPPYWGLRDYGVDGQLGLERSPQEYVDNLVEIFEELRRALKPEGTFWLNLGDSYAGNGPISQEQTDKDIKYAKVSNAQKKVQRRIGTVANLKPKDLVGIPWRVAFALQDAGWWLRQDIIWCKPNPMPEPVTDRCTKAHEYIFLLTKSAKYWYDADAVKMPSVYPDANRKAQQSKSDYDSQMGKNGRIRSVINPSNAKTYPTRNRRSVWTIPTQPYKEAHFATFPIKLPSLCILAGCPKDGIVYDPFMGAGTTALAAIKYEREFIGSELNPEYCELANKRLDPHLKQLAMGF